MHEQRRSRHGWPKSTLTPSLEKGSVLNSAIKGSRVDRDVADSIDPGDVAGLAEHLRGVFGEPFPLKLEQNLLICVDPLCLRKLTGRRDQITIGISYE
jgi:hypothetical protein